MSNVLDNPGQIAVFRLSTMMRAFHMEVKTGMKMTSRMPKVKDVANQYGFEGVRTKEQLAKALEFLLTQVQDGEAYYKIEDGICHFSIAPGTEDAFAEAINA